MNKIVVKDNFAFAYLLKTFYEKDAILNSFIAYKDFLDCSYSEIGKYYIIKIKKKDKEYPLETLSHEFINYVLSEMMQKKDINKQ